MPADILVADDEPNIRKTLQRMLELEGYGVLCAATGAEALAQLRDCDLVLLDVRLPDRDGLEVLAEMRRQRQVPVLMMSGHGTIATAVRATQLGALDWLEKPFSSDKVLLAVRNALRMQELEGDRDELAARAGLAAQLLGASPELERVRQEIVLCARTSGRVLICGETGTGKEVVARAIHAQSDRARGPWVAVNCAAVPSELIESELFGHEKGAFTGALRLRRGKFEQAYHGTLLLDEIGDMPPHMQAKLLRVLEEGEVERVGGDRRIPVDVRVLAATNRDLVAEIRHGRFREDLFHRLNVITIHLPPLRQRREDIPVLVHHFLTTLAQHAGLRAPEIRPELMQRLQAHSWPGNVRELRNAVERILIFGAGRGAHAELGDSVLRFEATTAVPAASPTAASPPTASNEVNRTHATAALPLRDAIEGFERDYIRARLLAHGGQVTVAARELGLERSHLYKKMRLLGIDPGEARRD